MNTPKPKCKHVNQISKTQYDNGKRRFIVVVTCKDCGKVIK